MRHRVVGAQRGAARLVDAQLDEIAELERAMRQAAEMDEELARALLRVAHGELAALRREHRAGVAHLPARFGVERRLVDDDRGVAAGLGLLNRLAVDDDGDDLALGDMGVIAQELGSADLLAQLEPHLLGRGLARADPALARLGALALHRRSEGVGRHLAAAGAQHVLGEVEREAVGVVELEGDLAGEGLARAELRRLLLEQLEAAIERLLEARLLEPQRLRDQRLGAHQLGIGLAHLAHQRRHQPPHQRLLAADDVRVPHGAAHDPAQHVAAPFLRRQHAVGDEER